MEKRAFNPGSYYLEVREAGSVYADPDEYEPDFEACRPGWKEAIHNAAGVGLLMFFVLYFATELLPLETEVISFGHLQFLNGKIVVSASWIRIIHIALLIATSSAAEYVCKKTAAYHFACLLLVMMFTFMLCMIPDLYLIENQEKYVPPLDRYHKQFEEKWESAPSWWLCVEKGLREPYSLEIDGEHYLYLMNYGGMFNNHFGFIFDREKAEIRIPVDGNSRFLKSCIKEWAWHKPASVTTEIYTDADPCRPILLAGGYDSERNLFVIPLTDPVLESRYGYCIVRFTGTDYSSRQLFGERPPVDLADPAFSLRVGQ